MLEFAVKYRSAVDDITGDKSVNLRKYELDNKEWRIAVQLQNMLKVHCLDIHFWKSIHIPLAALDIQGCHTLFLSFNA